MVAEEKRIEYERRKNYENSLVLTALIGGMFNGENVSYDSLFEIDKTVDESWKIQRDQFINFAENHNKGGG